MAPCAYPGSWYVARGWGIRYGIIGAVRLPRILVLTVGDFVSAQEGDVVNVDMTAPAATLALGLMYLRTNSVSVAEQVIRTRITACCCSRSLYQY